MAYQIGWGGEGGRESYESETYPLKLPLKKASFNSPLNTPTEKIVHFCMMPKKTYRLHNVIIKGLNSLFHPVSMV